MGKAGLLLLCIVHLLGWGWGGSFSYPCSFHTEQRGLVFLLLKRIIRKLEEYSVFSNFLLDGIARSQSGVCFDDFGFQCVKSRAHV